MSERLTERFEQFGAPEALRLWAARSEASSEPPRAYRMWWAGVRGASIDAAFQGEHKVLVAIIETWIGVSETQRWVAQWSARNPDYETLAKQIEDRAHVVTTGYRDAPHEHVLAGFAALAWLCRAAGAVESARARRIGAREVRARELAALVGAGRSAFLGDSEGLRFDLKRRDSPVNSELAYACSALAEAWHEVHKIGAVA